MRIDKFIWQVRFNKTRSLATDNCAKGKVKLNGELVKPSKVIKENDIISRIHFGIWRAYKIINIPKGRLGAKLVDQYIVEITSEEDLEQIEHVKEINRVNNKLEIKGRPTKKNRRNLKRFNGEN